MKKLTNHLYIALANFIKQGSSKAVIGLSRSILAADIFLKLVFNNTTILIPPHQLATQDLHSLKYRCNFFLLFNSLHVGEMKILALLILVVIIAGYFTKITCMLHFWITASLYMFQTGYMRVHSVNLLLTLLLIPVCLYDERKNHWQKPSPVNKTGSILQHVFLFFIKIQVAFIYFDSLYEKLYSRQWLDGTVIYYWFTHNFFGLHASVIKLLEPALTNIQVLLFISWGTLAFEALLAIGLIFSARFKLLLLKCGIIFHFSILLIHGFASVFFVMSAGLLLYLFPANKTFSLMIFDE